jgi:hypothetical protein
LHLANKCQSFEPKRLITISTLASASANNIRTFIKSDNDVVIEHVQVLVARLVVNYKVSLSFATMST